MENSKVKNQAPPEKILICAPSNAAIDEIMRKIIEKGILDSNGTRMEPFLVRVGPNLDRQLEHLSLDFLAQTELKVRNLKDDQYNQIRKEIL